MLLEELTLISFPVDVPELFSSRNTARFPTKKDKLFASSTLKLFSPKMVCIFDKNYSAKTP